jgi:hypothetical protein
MPGRASDVKGLEHGPEIMGGVAAGPVGVEYRPRDEVLVLCGAAAVWVSGALGVAVVRITATGPLTGGLPGPGPWPARWRSWPSPWPWLWPWVRAPGQARV